jgi:hypothetical protein
MPELTIIVDAILRKRKEMPAYAAPDGHFAERISYYPKKAAGETIG